MRDIFNITTNDTKNIVQHKSTVYVHDSKIL